MRGTLIGAASGMFIGGTGAWIGASLGGQVALRAGTAGISNLMGQLQGVGDPCFTGMNGGSLAGSLIGAGLGGLLAPGGWGTSFSGSAISEIGHRIVAGLPGASVSTTGALVGTVMGKGDSKCDCK